MSCLTCVVMRTRTKFIPFLVRLPPSPHPQGQTIPTALTILQTRDEDALLIRRRALEFLNKVIRHCGYDYVADSMDFISNQIAALLGDGEDELRGDGLRFFQGAGERGGGGGPQVHARAARADGVPALHDRVGAQRQW